MPAISVIVPVYKAEAFLRDCTDSVLAQTFSDFELLLIDDGSPDGSGKLCDQIASEDSRVRVLHKKNGGVSTARNLGMENARGDYLAFADSDDWMLPNLLETLYNALLSTGADSAGCAHLCVTQQGAKWREDGALPAGSYGEAEIREGIVYPLLGDRLRQPVLNGFIWRFLFSNAICRAEHICFEGAYLEDELFLMEYFCHAKKLVMSDAALYCYLQNPLSVTHRYMKDYPETFRRFMERKTALAERLELTEFRPQWRENSNWAGLLIAIGNEYAASNPASVKEKECHVRALVAQPEMAEAIRKIAPVGLSQNKQMVAMLVQRGWFSVLTLLYRLKNRG